MHGTSLAGDPITYFKYIEKLDAGYGEVLCKNHMGHPISFVGYFLGS